MILELDDTQVAALSALLDRHLADMSSEIAATDNPKFRKGLRARRDTLREIRDRLTPVTAP